MPRFATLALAAVSALALSVAAAPSAAPATSHQGPTAAGSSTGTNTLNRSGDGWCC